MNGNGFDHGHCYDEASNVAKGYFEFKQNYVHNCKANGLGYGLWVSSGSSYKVTGANSCNVPPSNSFNANAPDEVAYIHDNVFLKTNMTLRQQPAV